MGNGWEMNGKWKMFYIFFINVDLWLILFFKVQNSGKIEMCWNPGFPLKTPAPFPLPSPSFSLSFTSPPLNLGYLFPSHSLPSIFTFPPSLPPLLPLPFSISPARGSGRALAANAFWPFWLLRTCLVSGDNKFCNPPRLANSGFGHSGTPSPPLRFLLPPLQGLF